MLDYARSLLGIPYGYWLGDNFPADDTTPFYAAESKEPPTRELLEAQGIVCVGLINLLCRYEGLRIPGVSTHPCPGGTGAWGEVLLPIAQPYDPAMTYEDGTLLFRPYKDWYDQGHIAIVLDGKSLHSYPDPWNPDNQQTRTPGVSLTPIWPDYYTVAVPLSTWLNALRITEEL